MQEASTLRLLKGLLNELIYAASEFVRERRKLLFILVLDLAVMSFQIWGAEWISDRIHSFSKKVADPYEVVIVTTVSRILTGVWVLIVLGLACSTLKEIFVLLSGYEPAKNS